MNNNVITRPSLTKQGFLSYFNLLAVWQEGVGGVDGP